MQTTTSTLNIVDPTHPNRSFYIRALGTQASLAVLEFQQQCIRTLGGRPANLGWRFTDSSADDSNALGAAPSEKTLLNAGGLRDLRNNRHAYPQIWAALGPNPPPELDQWLSGHNPGAAAQGLRVLGLCLYGVNHEPVKAARETDLRALRERTHHDNPEIHLVASGLGGTGPGGILSDIADLVLDYPKAPKYLHLFISTRTDKTESGRARMNQVGLLSELNAAMCGFYHPVDLGSRELRRVDLTGALNACFLTTEENATGAVESLAYQHRLVAHRLMRKCVTFANPRPEIIDALLRPWTQQDRVQPGEYGSTNCN